MKVLLHNALIAFVKFVMKVLFNYLSVVLIYCYSVGACLDNPSYIISCNQSNKEDFDICYMNMQSNVKSSNTII